MVSQQANKCHIFDMSISFSHRYFLLTLTFRINCFEKFINDIHKAFELKNEFFDY